MFAWHDSNLKLFPSYTYKLLYVQSKRVGSQLYMIQTQSHSICICSSALLTGKTASNSTSSTNAIIMARATLQRVIRYIRKIKNNSKCASVNSADSMIFLLLRCPSNSISETVSAESSNTGVGHMHVCGRVTHMSRHSTTIE